ncbi:unnamed protein product, partial [Rotaria sp. Silwood2]
QVYEECKSTINELYLKYTKQTEDLTSRFENTKKKIKQYSVLVKDDQEEQSSLSNHNNEIKNKILKVNIDN